MKTFLRTLVYIAGFIVPILITGIMGAYSFGKVMYGDIENRPVGNYAIDPPVYNPEKPTVAVLLGSETTEVIDFLAPYELFSATNKFNVFAVAPTGNVTTLSGGLDVIPHYSFEELNALLGKSPDVLVVPYILHMENEAYQPVKDYIQKHSTDETTILSICGGAVNLAHAGLLDGKSAATHWADQVEQNYPEVNWIRNQRYVVDGHIVSSAGLSSGIDASLYVISQLAGEQIAQSAAKTINYPNYHYVADPAMEPFSFQFRDAVFLQNIAFTLNKQKVGVLLYDGIQETALASVFDTHPASATTRAIAISKTNSPVKTQHHLYLLPRYHYDNAPEVNRLFVPGTRALRDAEKDAAQWSSKKPESEIVYVHAYQPERFVLEAPIEDLAKQTNIPTAEFAAKRLEYREGALQLEGKKFPTEVVVLPILLGMLSLLIVILLDVRFFRRRKRR